MVAAPRTTICSVLAIALTACGVVLPPAEEGDLGSDRGMRDPMTTKGASLPPSSGSEGNAGISVNGSPGQPGDAGAPSRTYSVFVTSRVLAADEIGGLLGADVWCASLASHVPKLSGKTWAAWLSSATTPALARLGATPGPWVRVDGVKVANDRAHLADPIVALSAPIAIDEQHVLHDDDVWTGTKPDGSASSNVCNGWIGSSGRGVFGAADLAAKPAWTQFGDVECAGDDDDDGWGWGDGKKVFGGGGGGSGAPPRLRLYCFEID